MKKSASILAFTAFLSCLTAGVSPSFIACEAVCRVLSDPLRRCLTAVSSLFRFPLFEVALLLLPAAFVLLFVRLVRGGDPAVFARRATAAGGILFSLFLLLSVLPARRRPPVDPTPPSDSEFAAFADWLVGRVNAGEAALPDHADGGTPPARETVGELSDAVIGLLSSSRLTPTEPLRVKRTLFPRLLARWGLLGYHAAITGEAVIEPYAPPYTLAFTAAHEAAHQAGVLSEGEASFVAYLALSSSSDPALSYAGFAGALDATLPLLSPGVRDRILLALSPRVRSDLTLFDGVLLSGKGAAAVGPQPRWQSALHCWPMCRVTSSSPPI